MDSAMGALEAISTSWRLHRLHWVQATSTTHSSSQAVLCRTSGTIWHKSQCT